MLKRSLRTTALLGIALVLAFFATGCDQFMSSALIYLAQNPPNYEKAIAQLNEGLTVVPEHGQYYSMLAYCYYNNMQYKEAAESYDKAIKFLPEKKDSLIAQRDTSWLDLYKIAVRDANKIAKAPAESLQVLADRANKSLDYAFIMIPTKDQNYLLRAFILRKMGKEDEAMKMYQKMIEINPNNIEAYVALGRGAFTAAKFTQATEYFKKALAINPADTNTWSMLGISYFNDGKYGESVEPFHKAVLLDPTNRITMMQWATAIYNEDKNPATAFEPLEKAAKLEEDEQVWKMIGMTAMRITPPDYDRAINAFKKAIGFNPGNVDYWKFLHDIYATKKMKAELKDVDKRIKELEKK